MATKLTVPRPGARSDRAAKVPTEKKAPPPPPSAPIESLDAADVVEEIDITEPSAEPPVPMAEAVILPPPPPAPVVYPTPVWLAPVPSAAEPPREPMRSIASSLVSEFERDSVRKSSPPVIERRKQLQKLVASAVGVAWFICLVAIGQSALHAILASVGSR